jgi:hypothetical protein
MPTKFIRVVLIAAAATLPATVWADPPAPRATEAPEPPRAIYRLEFTLHRPDDPANARLATYTITLEERHPGSVSIGANVPLSATAPTNANASASRVDVGLMLRASFVVRGNVVVVTGEAEMSTAEPSPTTAPTIHRVRADGVVPVTPGHPASFTTLTDPGTRRPYEITVNATRVL